MSEDRKVNLVVAAENQTRQAFEEIKRDAKGMGQDVARAADDAARGIFKLGENGDEAAQKLKRGEGSMVAMLKRVSEQAQVAARAGESLADAFEIKIENRGFDASKFAPMIAGLRDYESAISVAKAREAEFAAQNAFSTKAVQAQEMAKASQYVSWWAEELKKVDAAERKLASESAFINSLKVQSEAIGKTRADLLELQAAQMGVATQAAPYIAKLRESEGAMGAAGKSAKELQFAMRGVPAQISDIVVSLQGGIPLMTVFFQQGLQLRDMFGGFAEAGTALGSTVLGMVNPLTVAGAAAAALGVAYYQGSKEADNFRMAITTTGNASGVTASQLREYAREIDSVVGTQAQAASGLAEFVAAGVRGGDELRRYTQTAIEWERATGEAVDKTAEKFAGLQKDPLGGVIKLNEGTNFLTVSVYEQIKALEEQGRKTEASKVAMDALDTAMRERSKTISENLGYLERGWRGITGAAKDAWDAMLNVGRAATIGDQLAGVRKELSELLAQSETGFGETSGGAATGRSSAAHVKRIQERIEALRAEEWALLDKADAEKIAAAAEAERARKMQARIDFDKEYSKYLKDEKSLQEDLTAARNRAAAAGLSDSETKKLLSAITEEHNKKGAAAAKAYNKELTAQQKLIGELSGLASDFYQEWDRLSKSYARGALSLSQLEKAQAALLAKQPFSIALAKEEASEQKKRIKLYEDEVKAQEKLLEQRQKAAEQVEDALRKAQEEERAHALAAASGITLAEAVAQIALARAEDNYQKALGAGSDGETLLALQREIDARRELATVMQQKGVREANEKAAKDAAKEWEKTSQLIGDTLADYIMGGGRDAAQYLKRLFATLVLQPIVNYGVQGVLGAVGMGGAGGGNSSSGILSNVQSLQSMYNSLTGNNPFLNQIASYFGLGSSALSSASASALSASAANLSAAAAELAAGSAMDIASSQALAASAESLSAGASSMNGSLGGMSSAWPLAVIAGMIASNKLYAAGIDQNSRTGAAKFFGIGNKVETDILAGLVGNKTANILTGAPVMSYTFEKIANALGLGGNPKQHSGGVYSSWGSREAALDMIGITGHARGDFTSRQNAAVDSALSSTIQGLTSVYEELGKRSETEIRKLAISAAFATNPVNSKEDAYGYLNIRDALTGVGVYSSNKRDGDGLGNDPEKAFSLFTGEIATVMVHQLIAADLPGWIDSILDSLGGSVSIEGLQSALLQIAKIDAAFAGFGKHIDGMQDLSGAVQTVLLNVSGGIDALTANVSSYYDNFYSASEKLEDQAAALAEVFGKYGAAMPTTTAQFRTLVEQQLAAGDAGAEFAAVLLGISGAFKDVAEAWETELGGMSANVKDVFADLHASIASLSSDVADSRKDILRGNSVMSASDILAAINGAHLSAPGLDAINAAALASENALSDYAAKRFASDAAQAALGQAHEYGNAVTARDGAYAKKTALESEISALNQAINASSGGSFMKRVKAALAKKRADELNLQLDKLKPVIDGLDAKVNALQPGYAGLESEAKALASEATAAQEVLNALQKAELQAKADYAAEVAKWATDAAGSVDKLSDLRGEVVGFYEAQAQAVQAMLQSAGNIRSVVDQLRLGQLTTAQTAAELGNRYAVDYSMALATTGSTRAGYVDSMAGNLGSLSEALKAESVTGADWRIETAKLFAQASNAAGLLEGDAESDDYKDVALGLLGSIDSALESLSGATKSAEQVIADAVNSGSASNLAGLRAVIAALKGEPIPAFAVGTNYVPRDMVAQIHEGEAIVPKAFNPWAGGGMPAGATASSDRLERLVQQLIDEQRVQASRQVDLQLQLNKQIQRWDAMGMPETREGTA